ncbi:serine/threonine-protein kinase ULK4 [Marchantia polymorpha subsp. ruderalis]|uniref:Protein kinase domain-containing protein n=2 Tax=Marchantia polymorpha TaxID=3197 RepID=A0A176VKJ6_MARPO|nr:hypothetical protein AXG93_2964s1080 [Marchantia polymorpha subsp. ruderalis]PTQ35307.1 hypothetical protein MARPO_0072s0051 [Marchantia polymorpha]BBN03345.1 hypothetical protein Mp_2g22810 [Marchantia polymorpha subsp. ruderalis]|eukprot:PTQ35307.1 hypothetical protein MARPO_0072s0051 [Marchantia polymorpha]
MNQYHIYEAIGRGKHSTVYKGRKKKSIEYYAIKSVEKAQKTRVLQEVRTLHSLDHHNVLKFYAWYETSAHLWLVLEYCVGGDLLTLLRQDTRLPEESIHDFARDLVQALQFLHSKGVIYCDLKPSNILLDENGRLKLCDFGLARRLGDISKSSVQQLPQAKRGTPCYMAPELFQEGGVHSFGSDLWALGCVMYECFSGRPPFVSNSFTQLVNSILTDSPPPLRGNPTSEFQNLVGRLLVKDPAKRLQWAELREHPFWRTKIQTVPLPPQPALANFLRMAQKSGSPRSDSAASRNALPDITPSPDKRSLRDKSSKLSDSSAGKRGASQTACLGDGRSEDAGSVENAPSSEADRARRMSGAAASASPLKGEPARANGVVNVLRLSKIVKSNLQKEGQGESYRQHVPNAPAANDSDVTIENHDQELDFAEVNENDVDDDEEEAATCPSATAVPSEESKAEEQVPSLVQTAQPEGEKPEDLTVCQVAQPINQDPEDDHSGPKPEQVEAKKHDAARSEVAATPPGVGVPRKLQRQTSDVRDLKKNSSLPSSQAAGEPAKASLTLSQALWHPSDLSVRPIMISRRVEKTPDTAFDVRTLPVDPLQFSDFVKLSSEMVESFVNRIMTSIQGSSSLNDKLNTLRYVESLCSNIDAANILINGPLMSLLVKTLRTSKLPTLRVQVAFVMGLLIRHATLIEDDLAGSGIIAVLTETLRDKQEKVRRCAMATLGELLFYIATQSEGSPRSGVTNESGSKDGRSSSVWQVSSTTIALVASILRKGEDDVTQHYALKTIENISSQGWDWASRFTSREVINNLCHTFKSSGKPEAVRASAGSCLVRLVRFSPTTIPSVLEKVTFKDLVVVLARGSAKEQQVSLNLLNMALVGCSVINNMSKYLLALLEEKTLVPSLMALLEQGLEVLRGKAFVCAGLLCKVNRRWLPSLCNAKLMPVIERSAKEKDPYVQQCVETLVQTIISIVPDILDSISLDILQLSSAKRPSSTSSRGQPRSSIPLFPVVLHLFNSPTLRSRLVNEQVIKQLVGALKQVETLSFQGHDEFQSTLLQIIEVLSQQSSVVLKYPDTFIAQVLPSLSQLYKSNTDGDMRFLCFKIFFDILMLYLEDISTSDGESPSSQNPATESRPTCMTHIEPIIGKYFLPLYPKLVDDEDPIPMYAHKLLVMLLDHKCIKIVDILQLKLVSQFFEFLSDDLSTINLHNVRLCLFLASAPEVDSKSLSALRVVGRIGSLLEFVHAKGMEDFLDPVLSVCKFFLIRNAGSSGGKSGDGLIQDIEELCRHSGIFVELCGSHDRISETSAECLVLTVKASPTAASSGVLANLSKVAQVLESCVERHDSASLQRRLLFVVSTIFKEQRMASGSSLPVPKIAHSDFIALENIVIRLRRSSAPQVAEAAVSAAFELHHLPRNS